MKFKRLFGLFCLLICLTILAGCVFDFVSPIPLSSGLMTAASPDIDVQSDGTKHIVWQERRITGIGQETQVIIYKRTKVGEDDLLYTYAPPTGYEYVSPDVAVTDSGYAYLVWRKDNKSDPSIKYGCFDIIPPAGSAEQICQELTNDPDPLVVDPPRVFSRGLIVYALFNKYDTVGIRLRYRQLQILDDRTGWVSSLSAYRDMYYEGAIDSAGNLHVTWTRYGGSYPAIYYNTNASADAEGNMTRLRLLDDNALGSSIAIAGTSPEEAFVMYEVCVPCRIYLHHCGISSCSNPMAETAIPYTPDPDSWHTNGADLGVSSNILFIAFAATNSETGFGNNEIYLYSHSSASIDRLTNNSVSDRDPLVEDGGGSPMVAFLSGADPDISLMIWDQLSGIRKIKDIESNSLFAYDHKMVGKNDWVAGVWLDNYSAGDDTPTPWLSFNAYLVNLPMIVK